MSNDLSSEQLITEPEPYAAPRAVGLLVATVGLFFAAQFIGVLILILVLKLIGQGSGDLETSVNDSVAVQFLAVLLVEMVTIGGIYLVMKLSAKKFLASLKLNVKMTWSQIGWTLLAYVLYLMTFIVVAEVLPSLLPAVDVDQIQQLGFDSPAGPELLLVFSSLVILPSIAEEILFRGFLYQGLKRILSTKPAAILTSILFGSAHLEFLSSSGGLNYIAAIDTMIFSFFLIWLFEKTGSLWPAIILHALKNSIAFVVLFLI